MPPTLSQYVRVVQVDNLKTQKVFYVDGESRLLDSLLLRIMSLDIRATRLEASSLSTNETLNNVSSPDSLVLLDGYWLLEHANENVTLSFLKFVSSHHGKLAVVERSTPVFFDALKNAGVYDFPQDMNPANGNSPLAGFRLKILTTPTGAQYESPWLLFSDTSNIDDLLEAVNYFVTG